MIYLILIATSLILFGGFFLLVAFERGRGLRVAGSLRNRLDSSVSRASFIVTHVDWGAFVRHLVGTAFERVLHDVAHGTLRITRSAERTLTRMVKALRERRGIPALDAEEAEAKNPFRARFDKVVAAVRSARKASRRHRKPRSAESE